MDATHVSNVLKMTDLQWEALDRLELYHTTGQSDSMPGVITTGWVTPDDEIADDHYRTLLVRGYAEMRYLKTQVSAEYRISNEGLRLLDWRENLKETLFREWLDKQKG